MFTSNDSSHYCSVNSLVYFFAFDRNDIYENMDGKYKILQEKDDQVGDE
jgi:hypothetical protein